MSYQDTWVRGHVSQVGDRACADRYAVIRELVVPYARPLTVWDLGANLGYFGCRLADEFGCRSIMIDQRPALVDICRQNAIPTTVAMTHRLSAQDLVELAASEHADVVLALNVLHHLHDWPLALAAILEFGGDIVIETPGRGDVGCAHYERSQAILDALESLRPEVLQTTASHVTPGVQRPIYRLRRPKSAVTAGYAYRGRVRRRGPYPVRPHVITSTLADKTVQFDGETERLWSPGMNLWNWAQLGGSYPSRADVQRSVCETYSALTSLHGDFRPWNLILEGSRVSVIDAGHRDSCDDATGLSDTLVWIRDPAEAWGRCA